MAEGKAKHWHLHLGPDYPGFQVFTFAAGTTTHKDVWRDPDKLNALTAPPPMPGDDPIPVVAGADGWVQFYGDGDYRLDIKDRDGVLLKTFDPIRITDDVATIWEGSHGSAIPSVTSANRWHLFTRHNSKGQFQGISINDGTSYKDISGGFNAGVFNVKTYGAVGDGVTDDTVAIQAAIDAADTGAVVHFPAPASFYKITESTTPGLCLKIDGKSYLTLTGGGEIRISSNGTVGTPLAAIRLLNTCSNLTFDGLHISGTENATLGDAAVHQQGIVTNSGQTISRVLVTKCTFNNLNVGTSFNANLSGSYVDSTVAFCHFKNIVGGGDVADLSGQGYAIHMSGTERSAFIGNVVESAGRHSIYVANDRDAIVIGNRIVNHRSVGSTVNWRPAIACFRSDNIVITDNTITNFRDGAIIVSKVAGDSESCRNIIVKGNTITHAMNAVAPIRVGELSTDVTDETFNVTIAENNIEIDGTDSTQREWLRLLNGYNIVIRDNQIWTHDLGSGNSDLMRIGDTTYSLTTNTGAIRITNNIHRITATTGGEVRLMRLMNTPIFESNMEVEILGNTWTDDGTPTNVFHEFFPGAVSTVDNKQLVMKEWDRAAMSVASAATVLLPPQADIINVTGTTTITAFTAGYVGRIVYLTFSGIVTVTHSTGAIELQGSANFVTAANDRLVLMYDGVSWNEISRTVA